MSSSVLSNFDSFENKQMNTIIFEEIKIHNNKNDEEILKEYLKAEKSNSIKTILYHFIEFIKATGDQVVIEALSQQNDKSIAQIRKEFQWFIKQKKLNQHTVLSLFNSQRFSIHFEYYLKYYSLDCILTNNMKDYKKHLICIVFLERCFRDKNLINNIKTYKKKNQEV